ncbi:F0F1 ATP synthase subunit I [Prodigiosinella confusarubida]|uniref:F0F1 ATP synthase subunit I n=1 Tax=Serratia sp. (strain ATCC 39006) TaxID=104623 RepID=A0A2I5TEW0_SERS3|nr:MULTISPECIES: F0F1 ATP synthase subunit I [Enterobacterales]AUG98788.1 F0F1 ATP synthase subunit I [Serratia sp. ATCC 39006]AUH03103.1 F0F1 ATP synthase subunit I [Serratia sp. ATCC 39006]WJV53922.1 F0F1 ATP synthase subunit I [Prodigiosinella sp. LS101]WJV58284.1 F0F1 ATP synthase subunit I [Pectobacteriaceae bacterium C111]
MSVSLYSGKLALWSLLIQLVTFLVLSAIFSVVSLEAAASALGGGLAAWLPNMLFMLFALRHQTHKPSEGRVAWSFALGEALKVLFTIALLVVALGGFHAAFFPLGLTYLSMLVMQIVAPAVINRYRS